MNIQVRVPDQYSAPPPQHYQEQELCCEIVDPTNTLERKQLISLLKQRYGNDIDANTASSPKHISMSSASDSDATKGRKIRQHCERVLVHAAPLQKNIREENRELFHHGGVHHSPAALNGSWDRFSGTGSEGSDDSLPMQRRHVLHGKIPSSQHTIMRRSDSEDASDGSKNGSCERLMPFPMVSSGAHSKGVAFLQYLDDVKRVRLPSTVTSIDTVQALFATSFTDHISMQDFEDGLKVVYIKDSETGTYYMLEDVSDVTNHCFLKVHEKSPSWKSSNMSQLSGTDSCAGSDGVANSRTQSKTASMDEHVVSKSIKENKLNDLGYEINQNAFQLPVLAKQNTVYNETGMIYSTDQVNNTINMTPRGPHQTVNGTNKHPSYEVLKSASAYPDTTFNNHVDMIVDSLEMVRTESNALSGSSDGPHINIEGTMSGDSAEAGFNASNDYLSKIGTVEDQLEDLSELLKTGIVDVKADHHLYKEIPHHTKHNENLDSREKESPDHLETNGRETQSVIEKKAPLPSHNKPTIMVAAQQQPTPLPSNDGALPHSVITKAPDQNVDKDPVSVKKVTVVEKQSTLLYPHRHHDYEAIDDIALNVGDFGVVSVSGYDVQAKSQQNQQHQMYYNLPATNSSTGTISYERIQRNENTIEDLEVRPTTTDELKHDRKIGEYSLVESCLVEGNDTGVPGGGRETNVDSFSEMHSSTVSDTLMDQIMNMELEVLQRSDPSLVNIEPLGSRVDKSCINPYTEIDDPVLVDAFDCEPCASNSELPKFKPERSEEGTLYSASKETDGSTSMRHVYAKISKVTALPGSETSVVSSGFNECCAEEGEDFLVGSGEMAICHGSASAQGLNELEDTVQCVYSSLKQLRSHLCDLRKHHTDGVRSFKADIQKKLLEFRKKASRVEEGLQQQLEVNNKIIFEDKHPVRERRHRLTADQQLYNRKISDTEVNLGYLEVEMENVRLSVIEKKFVDDPEKLRCLHQELTQVTRGLAEIKNRFHGLHDMLNVVITDELKIISGEEKFIEEEPLRLDGLIKRCKNLSGTLFTLERLAAVQSEQQDGAQQQKQVHGQLQHQSITSTPSKAELTRHSNSGSGSAANYNYNQCTPFNDTFDIETLKGKRNVRFKQKH